MPALRGHSLFRLDFGSRSLCIYLLGLWVSPSALFSHCKPSRPDFPAALNSVPVYFCSPYLLTYRSMCPSASQGDPYCHSCLPGWGLAQEVPFVFDSFFPTSYQALSACQTLGLGLSPCPILPLWSDYLESSCPEVYIAPVHGDT